MSHSKKVHLALNVSNLERSIKFYRDMFGIDPVKWKTGYAKFDIDEPALNLTLNYECEIKNQGALNHLGIEVGTTADVIAAKERLQEAGLLTLDEMNVDCCYALQDKIWITDPDGYRWEIFVVKVPDTRPELHALDQSASDGSKEPSHCCSQ